jgi:acetyl-CoA carboxylase biotin carboxylase subunit
LYSGYRVPPHYDSMVAKLIVHCSSRNECLMRLRRALDEYAIGGIETTLPLHRRLVREPDFIDGAYNIHWLEKFIAR